MGTFRILILDYRRLALALLAITLCIKAFVPAGFMIERKSMILTVSICADGLGANMPSQLVIPMKADPVSHSDQKAKRDGNCAFTSLSLGALASADPAILFIALLFILALGFAAIAPYRLVMPDRLLPPAQGPPVLG
jgi:hypothetical protein